MSANKDRHATSRARRMCVISLGTRGALDGWSRGRSTAALGGLPTQEAHRLSIVATQTLNPTTIGHDSRSRRRREQVFFVAMAVITVLTVLVGFARTYYLKPFRGAPPLPLLIHLHAAIFTTWLSVPDPNDARGERARQHPSAAGCRWRCARRRDGRIWIPNGHRRGTARAHDRTA